MVRSLAPAAPQLAIWGAQQSVSNDWQRQSLFATYRFCYLQLLEFLRRDMPAEPRQDVGRPSGLLAVPSSTASEWAATLWKSFGKQARQAGDVFRLGVLGGRGRSSVVVACCCRRVTAGDPPTMPKQLRSPTSECSLAMTHQCAPLEWHAAWRWGVGCMSPLLHTNHQHLLSTQG